MDLKLSGKRALVTGGARGIGRAIAERLVAEGCSVALCARSARNVELAVASIRQNGGNVIGSAFDVRHREVLFDWVQQSGAALGGLDVVVANASGLSEGTSPEAFRTAFEVDLMHTVNLVEAAMPFLERSESGSIVAVASVSAVEDYGYHLSSYGALKAALLHYIKSLANHVAPKGIRANAVSPGTTFFAGGYWHEKQRRAPDVFADAMSRNPMGRMATPEEIADVAVFTASPVASFVTGANIVVDGGYTNRVQN